MRNSTINTRRLMNRAALLLAFIAVLAVASTRMRAEAGMCGGNNVSLPFADVQGNQFFCQIAAAYFSGLTNGTGPNSYSPGNNVSREQMAAFITRTLDQSLRRGSRRAALERWWTPQGPTDIALTTVGQAPRNVKSDGEHLWVANGDGTVSQVQASTGKLLGTWTGADTTWDLLVARGGIYVTGLDNPGKLYRIDPAQSPGAMIQVPVNLGNNSRGIAYDGSRIWITNTGFGSGGGSVSIVSFNPLPSAITISTGFVVPTGILYDGNNIWVGEFSDGTIKKLDADGNIIHTVDVDGAPKDMVFDGTNIWVTCTLGEPSNLTVIRAATGAVIATLTGNGIFDPTDIAFDGERILVTNLAGDTVSMWKATDLTPLGFFPTGNNTDPQGVCSDGINFWVTLFATNRLARF
ncbi:MAG TPA: S-layer homology domain-containing protein [Blastocatellia bacterium]|nr:S-layer homology domain-containing protein [Blastocatellia bacterium]